MSNELFNLFKVPCRMLVQERVPDGLGGWKNTWKPGTEFSAAVIKDNTLAARVAEKQGVKEVYTVTTDIGLGLQYHEVFERLKDKAVFRVTSNSEDSSTPKEASFHFEQVFAERWELT